MTALRRLTMVLSLVVSVSAIANGQTVTPTAVAATPGTPTPTGTVTTVLIAVDNLAARGSVGFSTNFDAFATGTFAENLNLSGITFTPDPPGSWQTANATTQPFGAPFQTLRGEVLLQSVAGVLIISFASPVNSFTCNFAMNQPSGTSAVSVQTYSGTTQVDSISQLTTVGTVVGEGTINLNSSSAFDKVRLSAVSAVTPTPTSTTGSGSGSLDPTGPCCGGVNAPGAGLTGGSGCSIGVAESAPPVLLALPFVIAVVCFRRRGGATG